MPSLLESVANLLGQDGTSAKLGSLIGGDAKQAETAVETAGPALLGALAEKAVGDDGPASVSTLLDLLDASTRENPLAVLEPRGGPEEGSDGDGDGAGVGELMLTSLFGEDRSALIDGLASRSGLDGALFGQLLPVVTPMFLATVVKRGADDGLDVDGVARLVSEEREALETDGKLGDWFSNIIAREATPESAGSDAVSRATAKEVSKSKIVDGKAVDGKAVDGKAVDGKAVDGKAAGDKAAGDKAAGDKGSLAKVAAAKVSETKVSEKKVAESKAATAKAARRKKAAGAKAGEASKTGDGPDADDALNTTTNTGGNTKADGKADSKAATAGVSKGDDDAKAALAAVAGAAAAGQAKASGGKAAGSALAARAAGAFSRLRAGTGSTGATGSSSGTTVIDRGRNSGAWIRWAVGSVALIGVLAFAVSRFGGDSTEPLAAEGAAVGAADGAEPGGAEPGGAEGEVVAGDGADRDGDETGAGDVAESDPAAPTATTTVEAPTTEAPTTEAPTTTATAAPSGAELDALVQDALAAADLGSGVTAVVADGVVTLSGSVTTDEARGAAEAAVAGVPGVVGVDNTVTVDGSAPVSGSGSSLNDRLGLGPITFRYLSARITPEAEVVLDQVVAHLQSNPGDELEIQGHTDSDGSVAKNQTLSQIRAESVKAYLVSKGIEPGRLTPVGFGESSPKVPNDSLANKAINRRIELILK